MKLTKIININENCWNGYEMIGMKMKDGKKVPNCVPKNEIGENVTVKKDRRGNDTDTLIVKLDGKEYEVTFSANGWQHPYGIGFPNEDTYRLLYKDKKAKSLWNKMKPMVDKYLKTKNENRKEQIHEASEITFGELEKKDQQLVLQLKKMLNVGNVSSVWSGIHGKIVNFSNDKQHGEYRFDLKELKELSKLPIRWVQSDQRTVTIGF